MYRHFFKRVFDIIISFVGLTILSPLLLIVIIILVIQNNGTPFFYQKRPGKNLKPFYIIKFKSMTDATDEFGNLLPEKLRITYIGNVIRKTSIDELPQLINVLIGDMSLVGPRPLLSRYIPLYSEEQLQRHNVRPGITGWAQVNGRNTINWTEKFKFDIYYVKNVSLSLDILILWRTVMKVIKRSDINQSDDTPMTPFNGSN